MDTIDLEQVPSQIGTATLDIDGGKIVKTTGDLATEDGKVACASIYRIMQDTAKCIGDEPLKRITITFTDHKYAVAFNDKCIYIVKTTAAV